MRTPRLPLPTALVAALAAFAAFSPSASADPGAAAPASGAWPPAGVKAVAAAPAAAPAPAPEPEPAAKPGSRVPGALVLSLGIAGLGAGGIFGVLSMTTGSSARSQCTGNDCPSSAAPDISLAKNYETASRAAFVAGGVLAVTGLVLVIVAPGKPEGSARLSPWVGPSTAGVGLSGAF